MKNKLLLDTNLLLRLFINDVPQQFEKAKEIVSKIETKQIKGYISLLVINETLWILERFYKKERTEFIPQVSKLLSIKNIFMMDAKKQDVLIILDSMCTSKLDFTDLYLLYFHKKTNYTIATFDVDLHKASKN